MAPAITAPRGAGLGLRREFLREYPGGVLPVPADFLEIAPENWIGIGGRLAATLRTVAGHYPLVAHGLSLSLGGPAPLDTRLLTQIKGFLETYDIALYTEHLAYCSGSGRLYELLPLPFTEAAVRQVAERIRASQDLLGRQIAIENASYYAAMPQAEMDELTFTGAVLAEADCLLHLDVNNVYVNCINHGGDPRHFIAALPTERVVYLHVAGHDRVRDDLLIDTHGAEVIDPVWDLLDYTYACHGPVPTTLERDLRIPPLTELSRELFMIAERQRRYDGPRAPARPAQRTA